MTFQSPMSHCDVCREPTPANDLAKIIEDYQEDNLTFICKTCNEYMIDIDTLIIAQMSKLEKNARRRGWLTFLKFHRGK